MSIIFSVKRWVGVVQWHIRHLINECRLASESHHRTDEEYGHEGQQGRYRHPVDVARTFENVFKHGDFYLKGAGLPSWEARHQFINFSCRPVAQA
jgi:hypothetical protein